MEIQTQINGNTVTLSVCHIIFFPLQWYIHYPESMDYTLTFAFVLMLFTLHLQIVLQQSWLMFFNRIDSVRSIIARITGTPQKLRGHILVSNG